MPEDAFSSYIVFSERCELKKIPLFVDGDVTILQRQNMLYFFEAAFEGRADYLFSRGYLNKWLGYWSRSQRFLKKKNNSILRIYRPNVHTVVSHWFCAMENTVSFGDAVPIQNAVLHARLNSLSICCTRGFSFYNLYPLVVPSHTPIGLFNNQQRIKERNIHLPEDTFQTGSAGG